MSWSSYRAQRQLLRAEQQYLLAHGWKPRVEKGRWDPPAGYRISSDASKRGAGQFGYEQQHAANSQRASVRKKEDADALFYEAYGEELRRLTARLLVELAGASVAAVVLALVLLPSYWFLAPCVGASCVAAWRTAAFNWEFKLLRVDYELARTDGG